MPTNKSKPADPTRNARKAAERERKRAAGLVPVEVWVYPEHKDRLAKYVARINAAAVAE